MTNPIDIAPEHTKRGVLDPGDLNDGSHPDINAAHAYVDSVVPTVEEDAKRYFVWHGWSMREAFLAGISYAKENNTTQNLGD